MTYESFKQRLADGLREHFPDGTHISVRQFPHNNSMVLDGLTILEPGSNLSPAIYLEHYFKQYQNGVSFTALQGQILQYYYAHCGPCHVDTSFFTCFEHIRPRIAYKLIHYEKNKELLTEVPYVPYLDLAIVFYCLLQEAPYKNSSILICHKHLEYWGINSESLFPIAGHNTPMLLPFSCNPLADLILPSLDAFPPEEHPGIGQVLEAETVPMYVLTNRQRLNGACCILYQDVLKQVAGRLGDSLYILPSSIHEVIAIPASASGNPKELSQLVQEINITEVAPEEILSDHAYYYDRELDEVSVC